MATLGTARSISAGNRYPASSWILQTPRPLRLLNHCNIILMKQEPTYLVGTYRYVHVMDINNTYIIIIRYYVIHLLCNKSRKMILLRICFAYKKHTKTPSPPRLFVSPSDAHIPQGFGEGDLNEARDREIRLFAKYVLHLQVIHISENTVLITCLTSSTLS